MTTENKQINITRVFDAPRELVWKAWTDPAMVKQWWGPEGFDSPEAQIDLRPGGSYLYCMRGLEGDFKGSVNWSGGVYKEIVPNERLVLTDYFADEQGNKVNPTKYGFSADFPEESEVTVTFEEQDGKTKLNISYSPASAAAYDAMLKTGMQEGWSSSLDKLAAAVEKH